MAKTPQVDLPALLEQASAYLDELIKSEEAKAEALAKSDKEESSKEESKEESSKEMEKAEESKKEESKEESSKEESKDLKKDDGSHYEDQSPELSAPAPEAPAEEPAQEEGPSLNDMVKDLDDEMLQELKDAVDAELAGRQSAQPAPEAAPEAPAPEMEKSAVMKSEDKESQEKLTKAEQEIEGLKATIADMADILEKVVSRPVQKAVTDIQQVQIVSKGDSAAPLKKAEEMSDEEIEKKLRETSSDAKKLQSLTKSEKEAIGDYFAAGPNKKKRTNEILQIVNK